MGWGVTIDNIYLHRLRKDQLQSTLEENESLILDAETRIFQWVSATPREIYDGEGNVTHWEDHVRQELNDILADLGQYYFQNGVIRQALAGDLEKIYDS